MSGCDKCTYLRTEDAGDDYGSHPYPICEKFPRFTNLKSFPFKKEMSCHELDFWHSEFTDEVGYDDESYDNAYEKFYAKYLNPITTA